MLVITTSMMLESSSKSCSTYPTNPLSSTSSLLHSNQVQHSWSKTSSAMDLLSMKKKPNFGRSTWKYRQAHCPLCKTTKADWTAQAWKWWSVWTLLKGIQNSHGRGTRSIESIARIKTQRTDRLPHKTYWKDGEIYLSSLGRSLTKGSIRRRWKWLGIGLSRSLG